MATATNILNVARAEIGVKESPANSNHVKYNTDYYGRAVSGSNYAWCCAFVWWVFNRAGASSLFYGGEKTAYCPTLLSYHKARGQFVTDTYQPGDIIFFNFSGKSNAAHVGICETWDGTYITTIDGNTGSGDEANGGAVMRRKRHKKHIVGAYRPDYENSTPNGGEKNVAVEVPVLKRGSKGNAVAAVQTLLTQAGHNTQGIDGSWGPDTDVSFRKWQKAFGLSVDGSCGPASWTKLLNG